jgi:beta-lactamase regulating signal transducer with metallopeptidase domain
MGWFSSLGTLGLVAEYFFKTAIILILALLAAAASRRRPAAFRHFVLSFALIGLLVLPILSLAPVGWKTSLLPAKPAVIGAQELAQKVRNSLPEPVEAPEISLSTAVGFTNERPAGFQGLGAKLRPGESASLPPVDVSYPSSPDTPADSGFRGVFRIAITALWLAGFVIFVLRLAIGLSGAAKLTREGTALADPIWHFLFERFLSLVSLRRKIRLKSHPQVFVPLTWGWRKPVILMPADTGAWTNEERSSALFHELSHVKRADFLVTLLVRMSLAVFWWNPLSWIVYRKLRRDQEIACDELVLRTGIKPSIYAASLLAFRRSAGFHWNTSAALLGMLGKPSFNERLATILKQKLTLKEVKMKTKIMLAAAIVLVVALVGTARPAIGIENRAAELTALETVAPAPGSYDIAPPAAETQEKQAEKAAAQEKEKEKAKVVEKEKPAVERKIIFKAKEGEKTPIVITITKGDEVKTLTLDKPLTITTSKDGHVLVLSSEGREIEVPKGEPLRLEIKGGGVEFIKEGKALEIGEGGVYKIIKESDKEGDKVVLYVNPKSVVFANPKLDIIREGKDEKGGVHVVVETVKEAKPTIALTIKEPVKEGTLRIAKEFSGKPLAGKWILEDGKTRVFTVARDKEILEKVREIREQVAEVKEKKADFSKLEKSLEKLEAMLKVSEEKLPKLGISLDKEPGLAVVVEKTVKDETKGKIALNVSEGVKAATDKTIISVTADDTATIQLVATGKAGEEGREAYARAVAQLKKDLPEGYKLLGQNYDEESGTMTFKVTTPKGKIDLESLIKKLVWSLKAEVKK